MKLLQGWYCSELASRIIPYPGRTSGLTEQKPGKKSASPRQYVIFIYIIRKDIRLGH